MVPLLSPDVLVCHDGGGEDLLHVVRGGAPPQVDLGGGGGFVRGHGVKVGADGQTLGGGTGACDLKVKGRWELFLFLLMGEEGIILSLFRVMTISSPNKVCSWLLEERKFYESINELEGYASFFFELLF